MYETLKKDNYCESQVKEDNYYHKLKSNNHCITDSDLHKLICVLVYNKNL